MTGSVPLRVLLADDHAIVRKGIREFLEEDGEVTVVAEASDGAEAVRLAGEHRPAVAVLDVQMPGERVKVLLKFVHPGLFLYYHCHNLEHEDQGMMRNFRVQG